MLVLLSSMADGATLSVCSTCTHTTIGAALAVAQPTDVVEVAPGTWTEDLTVPADVTLRSAAGFGFVDLVGSHTASGDVVLEGFVFQGDGRCVDHTGGALTVDISMFQSCGSDGVDGGAIRSTGALSVLDTRFLFNRGDDGAAVHVTGGPFSSLRTQWCRNNAAGEGTLFLSGANATLTNDIVQESVGDGIVARSGSTVDLVHLTVVGNDTGVRSFGSSVSATDTLFVHNTAFGARTNTTFGQTALLWFDNPTHLQGATAAGLVDVDPMLAYPTPDCMVDGLAPHADSPALDAGTDLDPDGSPADLGAFGGPDADPSDFVDLDNDGVVRLYDCDDFDDGRFPGNPELCNGIDEDCDGIVDDDVAVFDWYPDTDGDGFGDPDAGVQDCAQPPGHVQDATDCDDATSAVSPAAIELCNGIDEDCSGVVDDVADPPVWHPDEDQDGYGNGAIGREQCDPPPGFIADNRDCDDDNPSINPGEIEVEYDGIDQNCSGFDIDDIDADGFVAVQAGGTDCDDRDSTIRPDVDEIPGDGIDQDCTGADLTTELLGPPVCGCRATSSVPGSFLLPLLLLAWRRRCSS